MPPPLLHPYRSTQKRTPVHAAVRLERGRGERTGPRFTSDRIGLHDHDLTRQHAGAPMGERIIVEGRVLDEEGRPVSGTLIELWQCNAAGRYRHAEDTHDAPLDRNFTGAGRTLSDAQGKYRFITIKPGAYPWRNHLNAWRPAHLHFSVLGPSFASRLVTQMYFPNDPLLAFDPIYHSAPDETARASMVARFDLEGTQPDLALCYRFDIILGALAEHAS
ncbi:MAG TPA: protocatechuate 3,4-dioxygenase subunit beta [Stellaceae bacterium]|nr:protocatechuate 3,4-dioxygenase subunit beta [Stellaceae bacterium]